MDLGSTPEPPKKIKVVKADNKEVVHNPEYDSWVAKDQQLLSYLLNSLTKEALAPVAIAITLAEAWKALEEMFSAHSKARITNLRMKLAMLKKGNMATSTYFTKMCSIRDELATVGKVTNDDEMVHYILSGLDYECNSFVTSVLGRAGSISLVICTLNFYPMTCDWRCIRKEVSINPLPMLRPGDVVEEVAVEEVVVETTITILAVRTMLETTTAMVHPSPRDQSVRSGRRLDMRHRSASIDMTTMKKKMSNKITKHLALQQPMVTTQIGMLIVVH